MIIRLHWSVPVFYWLAESASEHEPPKVSN
jgi:hypothetical protein